MQNIAHINYLYFYFSFIRQLNSANVSNMLNNKNEIIFFYLNLLIHLFLINSNKTEESKKIYANLKVFKLNEFSYNSVVTPIPTKKIENTLIIYLNV